jgi:sulfate adenylyltransferase large subunit
VYEDQVRAVTGRTVAGEQPAIDFALLTDGLRAEREQGITIDVAYRYFATARRKFIIADTPGHEQYTRNMATGASTADLAIVLIDARKGILPQSRRHAYIASLLGIRHVVAAINKMDLVDFSEDVYRTIERDFSALLAQHGHASLQVIPVSALDGDNVVDHSTRTPWYTGPTLLEHLEQVPVWTDVADQPFRLPVQRVIRPDQHYRGFAGQIASGTVRRGDLVFALPSGRSSRVASITTFDGDLEEATAPLSIALTFEDELDISRGDLLVHEAQRPESSTAIEASLIWFDAQKLETHRPYLLKHGANTLPARVTGVRHRTNIQTLAEEAVHSLGMNDIGVVELELTRPILFDPYVQNRGMGNFILIDPATNATLAAGLIRRAEERSPTANHQAAWVFFAQWSSVSVEEVERELVAGNALFVRMPYSEKLVHDGAPLLHSLAAVGLIVLVTGAAEEVPAAPAHVPLLQAGDFGSARELVETLLSR